MEDEFIFNGSPHDFAVTATVYSEDLAAGQKNAVWPYALIPYDQTPFRHWPHADDGTWFHAGTNPVTISVMGVGPRGDDGTRPILRYGRIVAQQLPSHRSRLRLFPNQPYLDEFRERWEVLFAELCRQGWIIGGPVVTSPSGETARPAEPGPASTVANWIEWYHAMQRQGFRVTFKLLAQKSGYNVGTFRNQHAGCEDPICAQRRRQRNK